MQIKQIIIWGHKLHSHTHSYIHNGFFIGFQKLGYPTYWFDDNDSVKDIDFAHSLFITEHQVNKKIPLRKDCLYLTHYVDEGDYKDIPKENIIILKISFRDFIPGNSYVPIPYGQKFEFYSKIDGYHCLHMYWATDLLPEEINLNIEKVKKGKIESVNEIHFVGSMTSVWHFFRNVCNQQNIPFYQHGATFEKNSNRNRSIQQNMELIQKSWISPALQDTNQVKSSYIPCRIFKNISYGKMGITNNPIVNTLFDNKVIFDTDMDIQLLMKKGMAFETSPNKTRDLVNVMEYVRDHHTYLNRIYTIRKFMEEHTCFVLP